MPWRVEQAHDAAPAIAIDATLSIAPRHDMLAAAARRGDLWLAADADGPQGFLCRDDRYFFERPFIALLVVQPHSRRRGAASALLAHAEAREPKLLWTSTNLSNAPMIALLRRRGYDLMGQVSGLDEGDPELVFRRRPGRP